ncbi:MAG: dockerin type I domain-containing protein [Candidatus Binatia bacterium]
MKTFGFRTLLISGLFVAMQAVHAAPAQAGPPLCNGAPNGIIDGNEQCETGPCCTKKCELVSADTVCRPSANGTCDPAETCGEQEPSAEAACPVDVVAADGTSCDDGQFCTVDDVCTAGSCAGVTNTCDDANDCTADTCNEQRNLCQHNDADDGTSCEDGSACTTGDTCDNGECEGGEAVVCSDDNLCTTDTCDAATGECVFSNNTESCDDGLFCTAGDVCTDGACVGGTGNGCDDEDGCTVDSCDEATDGCTYGPAEDGAVCDDGLFCTVDDVCTAGICSGATPNTCDDANDCTNDSCNEGSNSCKNTPANNGDPCDDGSFCTVDDTCQAGNCVAQPRVCEDDNSCTDDSCDEEGDLCAFVNNSAPCDDGLFCTTGDTCGGGTCSVFLPTCDDANACTTDACDEGADSCSNTNNSNPCEDGLFCTVSDTCSGGTCGSGPARDCGDGNACTTDSCDEDADSCDNDNNTNPCDDGLFCTESDVCAGGTCSGSAVDCGDGNVCTDDVCDETANACTNPANTDPCDDGLFCTANDTCADGACVAGPVNDCDDGNGCTDDSCNEATDSCDTVNNTDPCDDGVFCVVDGTCADGDCVGTARDCGDENACTDDSCDEAGDACVNAPNTDPCDDGLFCTEIDACSDGICTGSTRDCSDDDQCTDDTCNELTDSCESLEGSGPCEDGLFCTVDDTCVDGVCVAGPANDCDDDNVCTDDSCDEEADSCIPTNNTEDCNDLNSCTIGDVCADGVCVPGTVEDPECTPSTTTTTTSTTLDTTTTTIPECPPCGDVNDDCNLTAGDALVVLRAAVGLVTECTIEICDFNGSGEISSIDALATLRAAVGLPNNPQCPNAQVM